MRGTFVRVASNGDICIKSPRTVFGDVCDYDIKHARPTMVSIEESRYDPCRLFRKGDKVRAVKCNGRFFHDAGKYLFGAYCEVADDEENGKLIRVFHNSSEYHWDPAYLELVTPVEELEPYKVWDTTFSFNVGAEDSKAVFYYGADMSTCPYTKEQAKAAAEAERDRLNAEHRKERENG